MSPADISLTKGKDTICQMGWEGGIVSNFLKTIRIIRWKIKTNNKIISYYKLFSQSTFGFRSLFMSPANISLTKWTDTISNGSRGEGMGGP